MKMRGWRNIYHANGHQKKAEVAILISEKLDSKPRLKQEIMKVRAEATRRRRH